MDRFMRAAFSLARRADPFPNPKVGAVLVKRGVIIGRGYHRKAGTPHAEIQAIRDAKRRSGNPGAARGAALYVTLEPCSHTQKRTPPCTGAIIREGIASVAYAMEDPNPLVRGDGARALREAGIAAVGPTDRSAGEALNRRYAAHVSRMPFVTIKMAMSADGKTATRTGESKWISCEESRTLVHKWRSEHDAVIVGAGTVKKDDPELTAHGTGRNPFRIIVDGKLSIPLSARVLKNTDGKTIIATCGKADKKKFAALARRGIRAISCGAGDVDIRRLILGLSAMGIKRIMIEGGSELNAAALGAGVVNRVSLFVCPIIIGGRDAAGVFGGRGIAGIAEAIRIKKMRAGRVGCDLLLECDL